MKTKILIGAILAGIIIISVAVFWKFFTDNSYVGINQKANQKNITTLSVDPEKFISSDWKVHWRKADFESFIPQLHKALEKDLKNEKLLLALGLAYTVQGGEKYDFKEGAIKGRTYVQQALSLNDNSADAYEALGYTYELEGNFNQSIASYQKAISINPDNVRVYTYLGRVQSLQGDEDAALKSYKKALSINKNFVSLSYYVGQEFTYLKDSKYAVEHYKRGLDNASSKAEKSKILASLAALYATYPDRENFKDKILETAKQAVDFDDNNAFAHSVLGREYFNRLGEADGKESFDENLKKINECQNKIHSINPNETDMYEWLGMSMLAVKKLDEALKIFNTGIESANVNTRISKKEKDDYLARFYLYKSAIYAFNPQGEGNKEAIFKYLKMALDLRSGLKNMINEDIKKGDGAYFKKVKNDPQFKNLMAKYK